MKNIFKLILLLTLFVQSSLVFGQINFTNGGGDKLFSNAANWSTGAVPTATDKIKLDTNGDTIIVDGVYSVRQVLATKVKGAIISNGGSDTLYINANNGIGAAIQANGTDARVAFHLPVVLNTTAGTTNKAFQANGAGSHIKFLDAFINNSGHLTLANPQNRANTQFQFDGKYISTKWLNINANSKVEFGPNSDFTEHKSAVRFTGNAGNGQLTVKSAKDKFKTSDTKVIVNTGGTLNASTEDVLGATIQVDTDKVLNLNVLANQSSAGKITMATGTINLDVDSTVTNLNFADNSASDWGTGSVVVTGFKDKVIGFGSNNSGLTAGQVAQINIGSDNLNYLWNGQLSTVFETVPRLATGDIAYTGYNADSPDNLSFVFLKDILPGTHFFMRDDEVTSDGSFNGEGEATLKWENTTGSVISAGTSVVIDSLYAGTMTTSLGTTTKINNTMNLSVSGDGVFIYQTTTDVFNTGTNTYITVITAGTSGKAFSGVNESDADAVYAASGLTFGVNAISTKNDEGSPDGGKHSRAVTAGTKEGLLAEINNPANWTLITADGTEALPLSSESYTIYPSPRLAAGDIAFTGLNADGSDNLSFVVMVDIAVGSSFFISDNEVLVGSGGQFDNFGEGTVKWENTTDSIILAGTSIVIDSTASGTITASSGTATKADGSINLSASGDGVFAYQTSDDTYDKNVNTFLAHITAADLKSFRDGSNSFVAGTVLNAETGLTYGVNAIDISGGSGSPDGGKHDRGVTKGSKEQLLSEINSYDNWTTETSDGTLILPLSNESYEITAEPVYVPTLVKLSTTVGSVDESAGTFTVSVDIVNPYDLDSTAVQLVFSGTDSSDFNNFISDTVVFAKGVSAAQTATIPILDDTDAEGEESFTFTLRNVTGGYQSSIGADSVFTLTVIDNDLGEFNMVFNELHIDPASDITGDANGDGTRDAIGDEFIELINNGTSAFDMSGYYLTDSEEPNSAARHVFPQGTVVEAGQALVVFGGGVPTSPTNFGGAVVQTASENNGGVALGNSGRTVIIKNPDSLTVLSQDYDATQGSINQSITRSPDITGSFVSHSGVTAANGALFSPGMKLDSTFFYDHTTTKVQFQLMGTTIREGDDLSVDVVVTINGASSLNATTVKVSPTGVGNGTLDDIDGFAPQTVTFEAGSTSSQSVTINLTDDDLLEGNETIEFGLSDVTGDVGAGVGSPSKFLLTISDDEVIIPLVLNEVLSDPPSDDAATTDVVEGDANGDGTRSYSDDEFIELVNNESTELDISGYTVYDGVGLRHTFADGSILSGGGVALVFGGGSPTGEFGGADIVTTATGGSLSLNNNGDKVIVNDTDGNQVLEFEWGGSTIYDGGSDQSLTRDPELTGDFVLHTTTVAGGVFSPGTQADGTAFDVGVSDPTSVQFALSEYTLANEDGSYNLEDYTIEVTISNPSPNIATQVEVLFTASDNGSASDINDYVGEVMTFSSGTSDAQNSVVKITNADIALGTKYDFALQNVSGGNKAVIGENSTFTLIIGDPGSVPLSVENDRADISISPNPTSDFINVKIDINKVLDKYFVTDMAGRNIEMRDVGKVVDHIKIDARNFDNGLYILGLNFEDKSVKLKFIKK